MKNNKLSLAMLTALLLTSSVAMAANDYPAADFQPKIVYSDKSADSSAGKTSAKAVEPVVADPNYPATNFQPKVLFSDNDYKHTASAPSIPSSKSGSASTAAADVESSDEATPTSNNNLFGLLALGVVGFLLYNKKTAKTATASASKAPANTATGGATGVEKYLEKQGINKTGVTKYLEKQGANPATGVAKYMAKQIVKDREAAAAKTTGVEKYLRKNG